MEALPSLWCITRSTLADIEARARTDSAKPNQWAADRKAAVERRTERAEQMRTAVIPIFGVVTQWPAWYADVSTVAVQTELQRAVADKTVDRILLVVDSPGGTASGVQELADSIYKARSVKPIDSIANSMAASAGYWIASAANRLFVAPGGSVGSVGVYAVHRDYSGMNAKLGIVPSYVVSSHSPYKVEGNPDEPLSDEARADIQKSVNNTYREFVRGVARNRGVLPSRVIADYGRGRMFDGHEAVALGMADGIATLDEVVALPPRTTTTKSGNVAADEARRRRWAWAKTKAETMKRHL
jgi:signal peptide peptidase SppA